MLTFSRSLLLGAVLVTVTSCGPVESERLSAEEILRLMEQAYASASTYRDSGTSITRAARPADGGETARTLRFSTAFRRPGEVRFAYKSDNEEWGRVTLTTASGVESWVEGAEIPLPRDSIQTALRGATAPSSGVSAIVAPMLFPEMGRSESFLNLTATTRLADQEIDGEPRIVVQGEVHSYLTTVWLDPETYLVMRFDLVAENVGPNREGRVVQTVVFDPKFAAEVAPADFELGRGTVDG